VNLVIPTSTLSTTLKNKDKILQTVNEAPCLPQAFDSIQVLRKNIREKPEIPNENSRRY